MKQIMLGRVEHSVKVTRIGDGWNVRVLVNGEPNQEIRVFDKRDIGRAVKEMLRWEDKCGNISDMAGKSRDRLCTKSSQGYFGKSRVILIQ